MSIDVIMQYFVSYGPIAIFVIVLLEYLNLPGFPAGVVMPVAGIWASRGEPGFLLTMIITIAAGLTGSIILYGLGRSSGGDVFLKRYYRKFPKQQVLIESRIEYLREKGSYGMEFSICGSRICVW